MKNIELTEGQRYSFVTYSKNGTYRHGFSDEPYLSEQRFRAYQQSAADDDIVVHDILPLLSAEDTLTLVACFPVLFKKRTRHTSSFIAVPDKALKTTESTSHRQS